MINLDNFHKELDKFNSLQSQKTCTKEKNKNKK